MQETRICSRSRNIIIYDISLITLAHQVHGSVLTSINRLIAVITSCAHAFYSTLLFVDQASLKETTGWIEM